MSMREWPIPSYLFPQGNERGESWGQNSAENLKFLSPAHHRWVKLMRDGRVPMGLLRTRALSTTKQSHFDSAYLVSSATREFAP